MHKNRGKQSTKQGRIESAGGGDFKPTAPPPTKVGTTSKLTKLREPVCNDSLNNINSNVNGVPKKSFSEIDRLTVAVLVKNELKNIHDIQSKLFKPEYLYEKAGFTQEEIDDCDFDVEYQIETNFFAIKRALMDEKFDELMKSEGGEFKKGLMKIVKEFDSFLFALSKTSKEISKAGPLSFLIIARRVVKYFMGSGERSPVSSLNKFLREYFPCKKRGAKGVRHISQKGFNDVFIEINNKMGSRRYFKELKNYLRDSLPLIDSLRESIENIKCILNDSSEILGQEIEGHLILRAAFDMEDDGYAMLSTYEKRLVEDIAGKIESMPDSKGRGFSDILEELRGGKEGVNYLHPLSPVPL